jgi:hypothetical protein
MSLQDHNIATVFCGGETLFHISREKYTIVGAKKTGNNKLKPL